MVADILTALFRHRAPKMMSWLCWCWGGRYISRAYRRKKKKKNRAWAPHSDHFLTVASYRFFWSVLTNRCIHFHPLSRVLSKHVKGSYKSYVKSIRLSYFKKPKGKIKLTLSILVSRQFIHFKRGNVELSIVAQKLRWLQRCSSYPILNKFDDWTIFLSCVLIHTNFQYVRSQFLNCKWKLESRRSDGWGTSLHPDIFRLTILID